MNAARTVEGELEGAPYRIDVPEDWDGRLVVYCHGFVREGARAVAGGRVGLVDAPGSRFGFVHRSFSPDSWEAAACTQVGVALARSMYRRLGFCIKDAFEDTLRLRQHVADTIGEPSLTILAGIHMGAMVAFALSESAPELWDGTLAVAGTGEPIASFLSERVAMSRMLFDHFIPGLPGGIGSWPEGSLDTAKTARELLEAASEEVVGSLCQYFAVDGPASLSRRLNTYSEILRDVERQLGGNPYDTSGWLFEGPGSSPELIRSVARHGADAGAVAALAEWPTTTGVLRNPVLAVNAVNDPVIPLASVRRYQQLADLQSPGALVQQWVDQSSPQLSAASFARSLTQLEKWIVDGQRPALGEVAG